MGGVVITSLNDTNDKQVDTKSEDKQSILKSAKFGALLFPLLNSMDGLFEKYMTVSLT